MITKANIYLSFNGNCEEAFNHYKAVFRTEFEAISRFNEMPPDENHPVSEKEGNRIMHVSLILGDSSVLMGSDTSLNWAPNFYPGNNFSISISVDTKEEADRVFKELAEEGKQTMPMTQQFWGDYFGMLTDKFGVNWMLSFNPSHS